ncbi:MAG: LysE family translocator [SAR86 cluster bacterium]|jgi:threonine/homoserine/homoserine lactone efflux protein|nr:LysE family translocator [SAR86 cluster bacterium]
MSIFFTVAILHFFAVVSPGPDFVLISRQCLRYGRKVALWTSFGIAIGILFHVALSLTGLTILIQNQPTIFWFLKLLASLYIGYLGIISLISKGSNYLESKIPNPDKRELKSITTGFLTNVLNPKALIFFITVFTLVIDPDMTRILKISLGIYMSVATYIWFAFLSILLTNQNATKRFKKLIPWVEKVTGLLLLLIALQILLQQDLLTT